MSDDGYTIERWGDQPPAARSPEYTPAADGQPAKITVRPLGREAPVSAGEDSGWQIEQWGGEPVSGAEDFLRAIPAGLAEGATGLLGLPRAAHDMAGDVGEGLLDFVAETLQLPPERTEQLRQLARAGGHLSPFARSPSTAQMRAGISNPITDYKPQTQPGKYAKTVSEFIPGAGRKVVSMALAPGVVSERVGQFMEGSKYEPIARAGSAVATGGLGALLTRPRSAEQAVRSAMPREGVSPQVLDAAERLMNDAAARGIRVTMAEAIEQVAPGQGAGLLATQRLVENSRDTRAQVAPMFAERPGQFTAAARNEFDQVAPPITAPSNVGPQVGQAAQSAVRDVKREINDITDPLYRAAETVRIPAADMARIRNTPGWPEARDAVRNNPQLARYVNGLPDNSVGFVNEVKKFLDAAARNTAAPMNTQRNAQVSAGYGSDAREVRRTLRAASPDYRQALDMQAHARREFLQPLLNGPLGQLAKRDLPTKRAIEALFPTKPIAGSEDEIARAVGALYQRNPTAARQLVRAHMESTFAETMQNIQSGANQYGAASFAAVLAGNAQQRANLREAVRALGPHGDQTWQGFNRFLEIAEATGKRHRQGSPTSFTAADLKDMASGRATAEVVKTAAAPQRLITALGDAADRWQLGRNLGELAAIVTDPRGVNLLRAIASRPPGSDQARMLAARLAGMHWVAIQHDAPRPSPRQ